MTKEAILALAKREARKQGEILSSNVKWFSAEQVELVRMPDKRVGWMVGQDCETLRIVMPIDINRIHLFDQDEISLTANEKECVSVPIPVEYVIMCPASRPHQAD